MNGSDIAYGIARELGRDIIRLMIVIVIGGAVIWFFFKPAKPPTAQTPQASANIDDYKDAVTWGDAGRQAKPAESWRDAGVTITIPINPAEAVAKPVTLRQILDAIREVEGAGPGVVGDGGRSRGPYQIGFDYYCDAVGGLGVPAPEPASYRQCIDSRTYSERIMIAYWARWCPDALMELDADTLARTHNGGPRGPERAATRDYGQRVMNILNSKGDGR